MKTLNAILLICALPALTSAAETYPICTTGIIAFTNPLAMRMGDKPRTDCIYSMNLSVPVQRIQKGYLLADVQTDDLEQAGVIFVATQRKLSQDQILQSGYALYTGTYTYQSLNGFEQTVYGFKEIPGQLIQAPAVAEAQ